MSHELLASCLVFGFVRNIDKQLGKQCTIIPNSIYSLCLSVFCSIQPKEKYEETITFDADAMRKLSLVHNKSSSYNKDLSINDLIKNSIDALHEMRGFTNDLNDLKIQIITNECRNTITIRDNGIGMTKNDLIHNIFTTPCYMQRYMDIRVPNLGVCSSFLIANNILIRTKHDKDNQYVLTSSGDKVYFIRSDFNSLYQLKRGTEVILSLKQDYLSYLERDKIKNLVQINYGYCEYGIYLKRN
eukprot:47736_1